MSKNSKSLMLLASLLIPSGLMAQEEERQIVFGYRSTTFGENSDEARFQRYRDLRSGPTINLFRFSKITNRYLIRFGADNVGYRDQRYFLSLDNSGKIKMSLEFGQIPLLYSDLTRTLYSSSVPGMLTINDDIQRGVENKTFTLSNAANGNASLFRLRSGRNVTNFKLDYKPTASRAYFFTLRNTRVNGNQPWGTSFGFALANEVPVPVNHRTIDVGAGIKLSNKQAYIHLGYDGSFFRNRVPILTWDNPLRISSSSTAGPSMARESLWPNTNRNSGSILSGLKLPFRSNATAFVSIAQMSNDNLLIPFTSNTALPVIPLSRDMSGVGAQVLAMNYTFTSRPINSLFVSTRYRQYKLNNKTEPFRVGQSVNYDTSVVTRNTESEPLSFNRRTLDADATWSPFTYLGLRAGFSRTAADWAHRAVEETTENTGRASIDLTGISWLSLRGVYERSIRAGSPINRGELLAVGQQPSLRQFDISDRNKDRLSAILIVTPLSRFSVNASAGAGKENYPATDTRTVFGLRSNNNRAYSFGFDITPIDRVSLSANYGYERYGAFQVSRTANPLPAGGSLTDLTQQFNDPRRDWTTDSDDYTRTFNASLDLLKMIPKTNIRFGFDDSSSRSTYFYGLAPNTVIAAPVQLPAVTNRLRQASADCRYSISTRVELGLMYRFDRYSVNDFAFNPRSGLAEPAAATAQNYLMLGYFQRPYKVSTVTMQLSYRW